MVWDEGSVGPVDGLASPGVLRPNAECPLDSTFGTAWADIQALGSERPIAATRFLTIRSQLSGAYKRMAAVLADGDLDLDRGGRRGRYRVGDALVIGAAYGVVVANESVVDVSRWQ